MSKTLQKVPGRIAVSTKEGLLVIATADIIYCSSIGDYTVLHLKDQQKLTVSCRLQEIGTKLVNYDFFNVHRYCFANLGEIKKYLHAQGGTLIMSDGSKLSVSQNRKELLLQKLCAD